MNDIINEKYTGSIQDMIGNTTIGPGLESFLQQLINRNDNVKRSSNSLKRLFDEDAIDIQDLIELIATIAFNAWQPVIENEDELERARLEMTLISWRNREILMKATYHLLRKEINKFRLQCPSNKREVAYLCN